MRQILLLIIFCCNSSCAVIASKAKTAHGPADDTVDFYHGDQVADPYRSLEQDNASETESWMEKQSAKTAAFFKKSNMLQKIEERLIEIEKQQTAEYEQVIWEGNRLFALKTQPPLSQPMLVAMPSWEHPEQEEVLVDPNVIDPTGATAVDWYVPSHNGKLIAVSMSKNDTESGDLYIYNLDRASAFKGVKKKGKRKAATTPNSEDESAKKQEPYPRTDDVILGVNRALGGGSLVWRVDDKGFIYTKYPNDDDENSSLNEQLFYHEIGDSERSDKLELEGDFEPTARIHLESEPRTGRVIATVQKGDAPQYAHYLRDPKGEWQKLSDFNDDTEEIVFAPEGGMFIVSREEAKRGKVLFLPSPKVPISQAKRLISETNETIVAGKSGHRSLLVTKTRLYINYQMAGPSELRVFTHDGEQVDTISKPNAAVGLDLIAMDREEILVPVHAFDAPNAWYRYNGQLGKGSLVKTNLSTLGVDMSDVQISEVSAVAKDGAKLPITLVYKLPPARNGDNPTLLVGNGGFADFMTPHFDSAYRIWLDSGGLLAFAKIRGGGEFGEDWHTAGRLTYKQNTFDDFFACVQFLIDQKYTSSTKLAVRGKNAGGLLMGVLMTQHPDSIRAVVAESGVYDMLRNEYTPGGEAAVAEYGTNSDEAQYRAMVAYSPYHHIPTRTGFPAALFIAGKNDRRIAPWHSRKMVARLQDENTSAHPILLKSLPNAGYGNNLPYMQRLNESAEILDFLFRSLGVSFK